MTQKPRLHFDKRPIILQALVGSHNYNLDTPDSDKDYKYFVFPTFDDLYENKLYSKNVVTEKEDYSVHDIRKIPSLLWKANLNFIEILFSKEYRVPMPDYYSMDIVKFLIGNKDRLSTMNLPTLFSAACGTSMQKQFQMLKDSPARHENIEKYGYDTKSACHAVRLIDFLLRMERNNMNVFLSMMYEPDDPNRKLLLDIKNGKYTLEEVQEIIKEKETKALKSEGIFKSQKTDKKILEELKDIIKENVKKHIKGGFEYAS